MRERDMRLTVEDVPWLNDLQATHVPDERGFCKVCIRRFPCDIRALADGAKAALTDLAAAQAQVAAYREFVRDAVAQGNVKTEVMLTRGIAVLESDPENAEWWSELQEMRVSTRLSITGGFTCPHCGRHSGGDLEDVHPDIVVTCEHCGLDSVVTIMPRWEYRQRAALEAEIERLRVTVADMYDESDVDALQHRINTLRAEIERLADTLETYRQFVRDIVTGGFVKGEVALSRGIATLESDPANDEWWSQIRTARDEQAQGE